MDQSVRYSGFDIKDYSDFTLGHRKAALGADLKRIVRQQIPTNEYTGQQQELDETKNLISRRYNAIRDSFFSDLKRAPYKDIYCAMTMWGGVWPEIEEDGYARFSEALNKSEGMCYLEAKEKVAEFVEQIHELNEQDAELKALRDREAYIKESHSSRNLWNEALKDVRRLYPSIVDEYEKIILILQKSEDQLFIGSLQSAASYEYRDFEKYFEENKVLAKIPEYLFIMHDEPLSKEQTKQETRKILQELGYQPEMVDTLMGYQESKEQGTNEAFLKDLYDKHRPKTAVKSGHAARLVEAGVIPRRIESLVAEIIEHAEKGTLGAFVDAKVAEADVRPRRGRHTSGLGKRDYASSQRS